MRKVYEKQSTHVVVAGEGSILCDCIAHCNSLHIVRTYMYA